jgi:hypothetical protein
MCSRGLEGVRTDVKLIKTWLKTADRGTIESTGGDRYSGVSRGSYSFIRRGRRVWIGCEVGLLHEVRKAVEEIHHL